MFAALRTMFSPIWRATAVISAAAFLAACSSAVTQSRRPLANPSPTLLPASNSPTVSKATIEYTHEFDTAVQLQIEIDRSTDVCKFTDSPIDQGRVLRCSAAGYFGDYGSPTMIHQLYLVIFRTTDDRVANENQTTSAVRKYGFLYGKNWMVVGYAPSVQEVQQAVGGVYLPPSSGDGEWCENAFLDSSCDFWQPQP
jgi:hypothetical protein